MSEDFEYKVTTIKTSGYTRCGNVSTYWESEPKEIDMSQYIPIEWIKKFIDNDILSETVKILLNAWYWEKENEISVMSVSDNSTIPLDYLGEENGRSE